MKKLLMLMHTNRRESSRDAWDRDLADLMRGGHLIPGSALGKGIAMKDARIQPRISTSIGGCMVIQAMDIRVAKKLMRTNPRHAIGSPVELIPLIDT